MKENSLEVLVERLILMVGKLNERTVFLQERVYQLETILLENSAYKKRKLLR